MVMWIYFVMSVLFFIPNLLELESKTIAAHVLFCFVLFRG